MVKTAAPHIHSYLLIDRGNFRGTAYLSTVKRVLVTTVCQNQIVTTLGRVFCANVLYRIEYERTTIVFFYIKDYSYDYSLVTEV